MCININVIHLIDDTLQININTKTWTEIRLISEINLLTKQHNVYQLKNSMEYEILLLLYKLDEDLIKLFGLHCVFRYEYLDDNASLDG